MGAAGGCRGRTAGGLAGALLAAVGDVAILARPVSGRDFDRANGLVPPPLADERWRSLWNGVELSGSRIRVGTATGLVGIGLLSGCALAGAARGLPAGPQRVVGTVSVAVFAVAGGLTHYCCGAGVLARQAIRAGEWEGEARSPDVAPDLAPDRPRGLLTASAVATLAALAVLSLDLTLAAHRRGHDWRRQAGVTPFPWVLASLATTGRLPAPVGGFLRPASISCGLLVALALAAADRG